MADRRITELTQLNDAAPEDLLVIVSNPLSGTPITKKIPVGSLFANVRQTQSTNTTSVFGLRASVTANTANVSTEIVAGKFSLILANSSITQLGNSYGVSIVHSNTATRSSAAVPQAFLSVSESYNANAQLSTTYLLDVGQNGSGNVSANLTSNTNTLCMLTSSNNANTTHKLKIRINGSTYYLLLSNTAV